MRALFVANGGGHLKELLHLSDRLPFTVDQSLWVTFDSPQSRSLLEGRDVRYIHYSSPRDGKATVLNAVAAARILGRHRFDVAISTGATVAVSFLPLARMLGVSCHYVESATRTDGPSLTGRLLEKVPGIHLYTQHPGWAGGRWTFAGSVFDRFEATAEIGPRPIGRAVVTVGASETYGFDRLVDRLVPLLPPDADTLWQTGCSEVSGLGIDAHRQIPARQLEEAMVSADLVVSHAGVGSALSALEAGRMPVLVPREASYGEHVDDHQLDIAAELAGRGLAIARRVDQLSGTDLDDAARHLVTTRAEPAPLRMVVPGTRAGRRSGGRGRRKPGPPVFVSWGAIAGRSRELAGALGADVLSCFPPGTPDRPSAPVRYLISSVRTVGWLIRHRPAAVIVTNPPIVPVLIAVAYGRIAGRPVILDDHPGSFGAQGYRIGQRMLPIHRRVAPMVRACLVTDASWVALVEEWGGRGLVIHEAPADWVAGAPRPPGSPPRVLFVSTFAKDEPVDQVIAAARLLPEVEISITGDPSRRPAGEAPANVAFVGFLDWDAYRLAVDGADVVIALTTEPTSAMRAAFEAVWAEKVLVVNDWPLLVDLFPDAVHVANTAESIAEGIRRALDGHARLLAAAPRARARQLDRWAVQLASLRSALDLPTGAGCTGPGDRVGSPVVRPSAHGDD